MKMLKNTLKFPKIKLINMIGGSDVTNMISTEFLEESKIQEIIIEECPLYFSQATGVLSRNLKMLLKFVSNSWLSRSVKDITVNYIRTSQFQQELTPKEYASINKLVKE
mmetsp:Transcript_11410/g.10065  ORF Transcript_11410/g.10065 Transcript_11410/m.10065 type:complete len:109 (+) Transcript_11410:595-921(+)